MAGQFDGHKNFAYSLVATAPSPGASGTALVVTAADGAKFPNPATDGAFNVTIWPTGAQPTTTNAEVARCTGRSIDTLTIVRAQEATSARTVVIGDQVALTVTAKLLTDVEQELGQTMLVPVNDVTLLANHCAVIVEEYVMDATHELIFSDPSEMAFV